MAAYRQLTGHTTPEGLLEETLLRVAKGPTTEDVEYLLVLADSNHPANEVILEALAVGSIEIYHLDRASFWVSQLLTRYPRNAVGRLIRIQMDATLARPARATEECRQLLAEFPKFQRARLFLAMQLVQLQKYEEAVQHFEELRTHRPEDLNVLLGLVVCFERMGSVDSLRPLIKDLEEHRSDNSEALLHLSRFAMREQRWDEAEQYLSKALQLAPNDHDIHKELAVCLYQIGKPEDARRHADRTREIEKDLAKLENQVLAVIKAPRDPEPRLEAARLCLRNGQNSEGLRWLSGALEVAPKHKPTHEALADYYAANGNPDLAAHHRALAK